MAELLIKVSCEDCAHEFWVRPGAFGGATEVREQIRCSICASPVFEGIEATKLTPLLTALSSLEEEIDKVIEDLPVLGVSLFPEEEQFDIDEEPPGSLEP